MEVFEDGEELRFLCIDLKSFFASVECVERGLDPMKALLAVADPDRGDGTICLAVSPAMKALGVRNRCRVFEIPPQINYIKAEPRMGLYLDYTSKIVDIYCDFFCEEDIHVYSVDEVFIDTGPYLKLYKKTAVELGQMMLDEVFRRTGLTATCGVGTNLYLSKVALDILSKHSPDCMGVLTQNSYRTLLWEHSPITDFWMIGPGTQRRLWWLGLATMKDVAFCDDYRLRRAFGINAITLYERAWGRDSTKIKTLNHRIPKSESMSNSQILMRDYSCEEALVIVREMVVALCLRLTAAKKLCSSVTLIVGYSKTAGSPPSKGTAKLFEPDNSAALWTPKVCDAFNRIANKSLPVRKIDLICGGVFTQSGRQLSFFDSDNDRRDLKLQDAVSSVKKRFGANSIFYCLDLKDEATALIRNAQIGGHNRQRKYRSQAYR